MHLSEDHFAGDQRPVLAVWRGKVGELVITTSQRRRANLSTDEGHHFSSL
jgi:hypothetical protein